MVRESGISATRPIFPSYLLPTFKLPFRRRSSSSSTLSAASPTSASSPSSSSTTPTTTPGNSPPTQHSVNFNGDNSAKRGSIGGISTQPRRLSRAAPDTLRCKYCSSDLGLASQIISKGFTGRYGRAFLVAPPPPPADQEALDNVRVGRSENRQLVTGWHVVADIVCGTCSTKLGWKYVDAKEASQKYKVGKFILETERVVTHRSWEDVCVGELMDEARVDRDREYDDHDRKGPSISRRGSAITEEDEVVFDSEDEDECEDIFAGVWDAEAVAKRRRSMVPNRPAAE